MLLTRIDRLLREQHVRLADDDECYFLREYLARSGYQGGETNSLILNLKKSPLKRGRPEWPYKEAAIQKVASELRATINAKWLDGAVLVPIPPSKCRTDPEYDDRLVQVATLIAQGTGAKVRELLVQKASREAVHLGDEARDVANYLKNLMVDEALAKPAPIRIGIIDDLLVTGAQFRAARIMLQPRFPEAKIVGFFVARRAIVDEEPESGSEDG